MYILEWAIWWKIRAKRWICPTQVAWERGSCIHHTSGSKPAAHAYALERRCDSRIISRVLGCRVVNTAVGVQFTVILAVVALHLRHRNQSRDSLCTNLTNTAEFLDAMALAIV